MGKVFMERGSIAALSFIATSCVIILIFSAFTLYYADYYTIQSNSDAIKAYYLAESAIEETLVELYSKADTVIKNYLENLHEYKLDFILEGGVANISMYSPPNFKNYIQNNLLRSWHLMPLNKVTFNEFSGYVATHSYRTIVVYEAEEELISIQGIGIYNNARKSLIIKISPPKLIEVDEDIYNLPKVEIKPLEITNYYQTVIL